MRFSARYLAVVASVITTAAWAGPSAAEPPPPLTPPPAIVPAPAQPAPMMTPDQARAAAVEARIVVVHLASKERVRLDRRTSDDAPWVEVCWSPCDTRTWADATYRVVGEGVMPSDEFALPPAKGGRVDLHVHPATQTKRNLGVGLLVGGVAVGAVGGVVLGLGAKGSAEDGQPKADVLVVGATLLFAGVATAIGGATFMAQNWSSDVVQAPREAAPAPGAHGAAPVVPTGVAFTLPILSGSF